MWKMILLALLIPFSTAFAEDIAAKGPHSLEVGLMYYNFDYKEDLPPPGKSTENGWLPGIRIAYGYSGVENSGYGRILFEFTNGDTTYDGSTQSGKPVTDTTKNTFERLEGNIGLALMKMDDFQVAAYTGLGYRYWERGLGGQYPYTEEYSWKYFPIGLRAEYIISEKWSGAIDLADRFMFDGHLKIKIPGSNNPSVNLGNKEGWYIEAPFYYKFDLSKSFFITPWYEYSAIGMSNIAVLATDTGTPVAYVYEPASHTNQYGINVGIKFW